MGSIRGWLFVEAKSQNVVIEMLPDEEGEKLRTQVARKFARNSTHWLWEHFDSDQTARVQNQNAWRWITDFVQDESTLMFFNLPDEDAFFRFQNGFDVVNVLSETPHFEFYLTNDDAAYLICFNHHDFLLANGTAKEWLLKYNLK